MIFEPRIARKTNERLWQRTVRVPVRYVSRTVAVVAPSVPIFFAMAIFCTTAVNGSFADRLGCTYCKSSCGPDCVPCLNEAAVEVVEWGVLSESICHACFKPIRLADCCASCEKTSCTCPGTGTGWNPFRSRTRKRLMRKTLVCSVDTIGYTPASRCSYGCTESGNQEGTHSDAPNRFVGSPKTQPSPTLLTEQRAPQFFDASVALPPRRNVPRESIAGSHMPATSMRGQTFDRPMIERRMIERTPPALKPASPNRSFSWRALADAARLTNKKKDKGMQETTQLAPIVSAARYDLSHLTKPDAPVRIAPRPTIRLTSGDEPIEFAANPPVPKSVDVSVDSTSDQNDDDQNDDDPPSLFQINDDVAGR